MGWYIGIDGGGTKTAFALADSGGKIAALQETGGISYRQYPMREVLRRLRSGVGGCLIAQGLPVSAVSAICIGYPCYGEGAPEDRALLRALAGEFPGVPLKVVNDGEVAWAGALAETPGVHVVAGTGSIAYGRNAAGESARCGGWLDFFSDEGSCYWLGRKAMQLFSREADERAPRGALYEGFRAAFGLEDDFEIINILARSYIPYRDKVAALQLLLLDAARAGDPEALALYRQAVDELVKLAAALRERLGLQTACTVTYSGGLFREEALVRRPFLEAVSALGAVPARPKGEPVEGAVRLAMALGKGEDLT